MKIKAFGGVMGLSRIKEDRHYCSLWRFADVTLSKWGEAASRDPEHHFARGMLGKDEYHHKEMTINCEYCSREFELELLHSGFGDCSYAYCNRCGSTSILSGWDKRWPKEIKLTQAEILVEMEPHLEPCDCGGKFTTGNSPRCPHCKEAISAEKVTAYIEAQSPGTKKGWRWQRNWHSIYCVVINRRRVANNFKVSD